MITVWKYPIKCDSLRPFRIGKVFPIVRGQHEFPVQHHVLNQIYCGFLAD